jgi:protein-tyrosine phosphatase
MDAMRARRMSVDPEMILPVLEAREEYLAAAYAEVERGYGGMDRYIRDGLGVDPATADRLRASLLE